MRGSVRGLAVAGLLGLVLAGAGVLRPRPVWAAEPARDSAAEEGALEALVGGTLAAAGDLAGAAGLASAALCAGVGDLVSLLDARAPLGPLLRGVGSQTLHRLAFGLSRAGTGVLEALRAEDIERLPEPRAAYLLADPGLGRLDTALDGLASLRLGVGDLMAAPVLAGLRTLRAERADRWLTRERSEARLQALGPLALD
ncbi:MAG: hypothetical protein ACE5FG_11365 [Myxococcota bacterium]